MHNKTALQFECIGFRSKLAENSKIHEMFLKKMSEIEFGI